MWLQRARRLEAAAAGAAATQGISGRTGAHGGFYRGGGNDYGSAGMLRAGGGPVGAGQGPGVPASETDPPPPGGLSLARALKKVGALPGLSSADFGAVAAILHQSQRAGGFANASGVGGGAGVARRGGDARDAAPMRRHIPPPPLVPPGGSERQRVYADWHVVGPVRLPSSRYMYVLIR
jgi:hypothetical protein